MPPENGEKGAAAAVGRFDEVAVAYADHLRSRQAGKAGDGGRADRDGGVERAETEQNDDRQRQQ